jgi:hypothetical protein
MGLENDNYQNSGVVKIIKFKTIPQICQEKTAFKNLKPLTDNFNFIEYVRFSSYLFKIKILFYFDWYPHVLDISLDIHSKDISKIFYQLFLENAKPNSRKWDIFINQSKIKKTFDQFVCDIIKDKSMFRNHFLSTVERKYLCKNCFYRKNILSISSGHSICYYYSNGCGVKYAIKI